MTSDKEKLLNVAEYKCDQVAVTANNSRLPISRVGKTMVVPQFSTKQVQLQGVYHVPEMKKNLLSVSQLTASGNYVVFGPDDVKFYQEVKVIGTPFIEGKKQESVYVM